MQSNSVRLKALALACGMIGAGQAFALAPTDRIDVTINISGASAQGPALTSSLTGVKAGQAIRPASSFGLCAEGTDTVYTSGGNDRAVFCTFKTTAQIPTLPASLSGKNVLLIKRDGGGSAYGLYPVNGQSVPVAFQSGGEAGTATGAINMLTFNTACTVSAAPTTTTPGAGTCPTTNRAQVQPDAGLSDVEPTLFDAKFVAAVGVQGYSSLGLQGFGVAMSQDGYQALQRAQGLNTADANPGPNQPTLSSGQIAAILADSAGLSAYQANWAAAIPGATQTVTVCRRTSGSGTQQSSNANFLRTQCDTGTLGGSLVPQAAAGTGTIAQRGTTLVVAELGGTGNVKDCLNEAGGSGFTFNANDYQIGVMSLENVPSATDTWRFIKVDSVSPNYFGGAVDNTQIRQLVEGNYTFAFETAALARTQVGKDFMGQVTRIFSAPFVGPLTGIAIVPGASSYAADPTQVARATRFGNSCQAFQAQ